MFFKKGFQSGQTTPAQPQSCCTVIEKPANDEAALPWPLAGLQKAFEVLILTI